MLQNYMTIKAYTQQLLDMEDLYGTSVAINYYCKKLTQVEVGYGLLNVALYVSCKVLLYFFLFIW